MDVLVRLTATGFQQHTILKTRPVSAISLTMPVKLDGLTARKAAGGAVEFVDADGAVSGTMAAPSMWDARLDAVSQVPARIAPVDYALVTRPYGVDVVLTPDMAFLTDPDVRYPVTIDPDVSFNPAFDTFVRRNMTTDASAGSELGIGTDSSGNPARAFLNWNPAPIRGKKIVEAHLGVWNAYSATCGIRSFDVYSAGLASIATRWTAMPSIAATKSAMVTGSKGCLSEPDGDYLVTPPHALDALVQSWADTTSGQVGMALVAPSETDVSYYKRIRSADATSGKPFLYLTYITVPPTAGCAGGADGDFNGDGRRDTAIADPEAAVNGVAGAGSVAIVDGVTGAVTTLRQGSGGIPDAPEAGDRFGSALAVYDTNLGGCTDLAIGSPFEDSGSVADSGSVVVVYGAPGGLGTGRATLLIDQGRTLAEGRGAVPDNPEAGDKFGFALSAGRTAIGEPYLIIGAPGEDLNGVVDAGLVHYLRDTYNIVVDLPGVGGPAATDDAAGFAIASSPHHIAVRQPGSRAANGGQFAGSVCLFTHAAQSDPLRPLRCLDQGLAGVGDAAEAGDLFGKALALVPYRSAGAAAGVHDSLLTVGVPGEDVGAAADAGQVQQFHLTQTAVTEVALINQTTAGVSGGNEAGDYFGEQVVAVNRDSAAEASGSTVLVAVGAPGEDLDGVVDAGVVHVLAGMQHAVTDLQLRRAPGSLPGSPATQELLGTWLGATPQHLLVSSAYGSRAIFAMPWSALAAGAGTPAVTYPRPRRGRLRRGSRMTVAPAHIRVTREANR